ncbi:hypothetical protein MKX07_004858 [Trichoderma sp. CBMAI-0711]|nr:hypothetical protein MKX07_004858 [Trichoderma sp. CBMAI-0711]
MLFCHELTAPASTQTIFFQPSLGSKSAMPAALSTQGFHTTTSSRLSRTTRNLATPASVMTTGWPGPLAGVYTRSVSPEKVTGSEDCVLFLTPSTLSW